MRKLLQVSQLMVITTPTCFLDARDYWTSLPFGSCEPYDLLWLMKCE